MTISFCISKCSEIHRKVVFEKQIFHLLKPFPFDGPAKEMASSTEKPLLKDDLAGRIDLLNLTKKSHRNSPVAFINIKNYLTFQFHNFSG